MRDSSSPMMNRGVPSMLLPFFGTQSATIRSKWKQASSNRISRALADPRRMGILQRIAADNEVACAALASESLVSQPTISHHLKELSTAGLNQGPSGSEILLLSPRPRGLGGVPGGNAAMGSDWSPKKLNPRGGPPHRIDGCEIVSTIRRESRGKAHQQSYPFSRIRPCRGT